MGLLRVGVRTPRSPSQFRSRRRAYRQSYVYTSGRYEPCESLDQLHELLAADGITLAITNKYGKGLGNSQKANFAPRVGFAYQATPKLVARGGFGMFYNGFENRGYSPNLGENYPFQFNFNYSSPNDGLPLRFRVAPQRARWYGDLRSRICVHAAGSDSRPSQWLGVRGIQFNYQTPYTMSGNFTLQYQLTPTLTVQAGYVTSLARHLEVFPGSNNPTAILPTGAQLTNTAGLNGGPGSGATYTPAEGGLPFPDFGGNNSYAATAGNSFYHGLQTKAEKRFASGLNFLVTYTYSKTVPMLSIC